MGKEYEMTREEAIEKHGSLICGTEEEIMEAIREKERQEPCDDAISRQAVIDFIDRERDFIKAKINDLPSVTQKSKTGHCKECKYFEYDSVAKVDGVPLIVAHEICNKWGDGCKTRENGYCFLFEPQESEGKE